MGATKLFTIFKGGIYLFLIFYYPPSRYLIITPEMGM